MVMERQDPARQIYERNKAEWDALVASLRSLTDTIEQARPGRSPTLGSTLLLTRQTLERMVVVLGGLAAVAHIDFDGGDTPAPAVEQEVKSVKPEKRPHRAKNGVNSDRYKGRAELAAAQQVEWDRERNSLLNAASTMQSSQSRFLARLVRGELESLIRDLGEVERSATVLGLIAKAHLAERGKATGRD